MIPSTLPYVITLGNPFNTIFVLTANTPYSHLKPFDCSEGLDAFRFFFQQQQLLRLFRSKNEIFCSSIGGHSFSKVLLTYQLATRRGVQYSTVQYREDNDTAVVSCRVHFPYFPSKKCILRSGHDHKASWRSNLSIFSPHRPREARGYLSGRDQTAVAVVVIFYSLY